MKRSRIGSPAAPIRALVWQLIAVDGEGHGHGTCGHRHATEIDAVRCDWAPPGWDDMLVCDLLVRQVRDIGDEPRRFKRPQLGLFDQLAVRS